MVIGPFRAEYGFLSNFYQVRIKFDNITYPTVEHAYQAAKTLNSYKRRWVRDQTSPGRAKWAGRALVIREDWEEVKLLIMEKLVLQKFTDHASLRRKLFATSDAELVEINTWGDMYWGVCGGTGENHLGKILMKVREELRISQK